MVREAKLTRATHSLRKAGNKPATIDPEILEFVRALARLQARRDHDREMEALIKQRRPEQAGS